MAVAAVLPSLKGLAILFTSEMYSSSFAPAVARSSLLAGLNCNALMGPVCFCVLEILEPESLLNSLSASHRSSDPFSSAPAIIPLSLPCLGLTQAISWNLSQVSHPILYAPVATLTWIPMRCWPRVGARRPGPQCPRRDPIAQVACRRRSCH